MTTTTNGVGLSLPQLLATCRATRALAGEAAEWVGDEANRPTVGRERETLLRHAARAATRAGRLELAAERAMCVGVFGPSQAGKSYLVEVLARPESGSLRARFAGLEPVDFLTAINPVGEKESTGLVTRFSSRRAASPPEPAGCPVRLRALTELDVVKVLGNTFYLDGDQTKETPPTAEDLAALLARLAGTAAAQARAPHLDAAAIEDLLDYFQRQFGSARGIDALTTYWNDARCLAPRLALADRAALFAPLWGRHEVFTEVYRELAGALEQLHHPDEIFVGIEALVPREGSILDVATLAGLGETATSTDRLIVRTSNGGEASLPRHVVCAIAAELRIELADPGRPFLEEADLLDFPGARSRQKVDLSAFLGANPNAAKETFLRGKVAFLFDRYVAEQELTAMLLCVRPSNQEVVTLPDLVDDWIGLTHGRTPEARAGQPNLLFLVMTWFDSHFIEKAGDANQDAGLRFRNRIEASLLGFFGKAHRWPREWTPGGTFRNAFWFRNPNYPAESIIRYDGRRELEFLPEKTERIGELRAGFASLPEAQAHFDNPGRAFDEALKLNDGGVGYLVERLAEVCRPELKRNQLASRLADLRLDLREQLERFFIPTDLGERLETRRAAANSVFDALDPIINEDRMGSLLRAFLIAPATLAEALQSAALQAPSPQPSRPLVAPSRVLRPGQAPPAAGARAVPAPAEGDSLLARSAIECWIAHLRRCVESDAIVRAFALRREALAIIVDELIELAARANLEGRIAADLRALSTVERAEQASAKVGLIAATRLNRLVGGLGFTLVPPAGEAPGVAESAGERTAFAPRPIAFDARAIGTDPKPFRIEYATDWFHGFYRIVEENAARLDGQSVDMRQNERLGRILMGLRADPTTTTA